MINTHIDLRAKAYQAAIKQAHHNPTFSMRDYYAIPAKPRIWQQVSVLSR